MEISKQQEVVSQFRRWFTGGNAAQGQGLSIKRVIEDNRRRYRMIMNDSAERAALGLSVLPSTKSTSIVDNAVVDAIQEYYAPDAISFTAEEGAETDKDQQARFLTSLFRVRAKRNGYWVYHLQSLKAGLVDGIEAGMVRWRKESYSYPDNHYFYLPTGEEISEEEYKEAKRTQTWPMLVDGQFNPAKGRPDKIKIQFNELYKAERSKKERVVTDTWECMQLKPGENLLWDIKNPVLDLNRGQWVIVIMQMQAEEILSLSKNGVFNKITMEELKPYLQSNATGSNQQDYNDLTAIGTDPDTVDMGDFNLAEVWCAFEKKNCQWMVSFSLTGNKELKKDTPVNDVFFGGRPFDRLPVFMGASDIELWEALGRGLPKLIAPIEDELSDHRNNLNDMAKQASTGKYRVNEDSDVDLNSLLNDKVFYARQGEVEKLDFSGEMNAIMRATSLNGGDIASLAPVGVSDGQLVGSGNARDTLGSVQLALGGNDKKLSTRILIRNITVMIPQLRIIAEMMMAFETDQSIGRIAGRNAKMDMSANGPMTEIVDGKPMIDFSRLDFDAGVQINAGLGSVPNQQKAQKIMAYHEWAKTQGLPVDVEEIDKQLKVLNGFNEDQFILPMDRRQAPPPPPVEDKLTLTVTFAELLTYNPEAAQALLNKALAGAMQVTTNVKEDTKKPDYLNQKDGSPSHPVMAAHVTRDRPQADMGGA